MLELRVRALVVSDKGNGVICRCAAITSEPLTGRIGQVSWWVLPLLLSERTIRVHDVYVPQSVVLPIGEAKVRARVNTKLSTDTLVRRDVIRVVFLVECGVVRQRVLALNTTHLVQDLSRGVVHVKLVEGSDLVAQLQTSVAEQHLTRNTTPSCRAPQSKVQLLRPKAHVRLGQPLPRVLCLCELDLRLGEDLPELGGEIVRWCYIDLHLLVKEIRDALPCVV